MRYVIEPEMIYVAVAAVGIYVYVTINNTVLENDT